MRDYIQEITREVNKLIKDQGIEGDKARNIREILVRGEIRYLNGDDGGEESPEVLLGGERTFIRDRKENRKVG